ncbi:MAG: hypothetical protein ACNA71_04300 [Kiritimatiellia bacterium]
MRQMLTAIILAVAVAGVSRAATFPGSISREPLVRGTVSERLSIGLGYDRIKRGINFDSGGTAVGEADSISAYVGYNVRPWLTSFVTVGGTNLRGADSSDYGVRLSAGLHAYLWEADVLTPSFAAGRISIKGSAEVASHQTDSTAGKTEWIEMIAALPIGYEFFDRYPRTKSGLSTSLALYVGPAVSMLDGDLAVAPGLRRSFSEDQLFGFVAGADVYFAPSVSLGFKALVFDETSTGVTLRFQF